MQLRLTRDYEKNSDHHEAFISSMTQLSGFQSQFDLLPDTLLDLQSTQRPAAGAEGIYFDTSALKDGNEEVTQGGGLLFVE
jgi:hypothetical protein